MSASRSVYKVFRSILFTAVLAVIGIFACLYIALSVPWVQNKIRQTAESELSAFFGGKVEIGKLMIYPFNELRIYEASFFTPDGERCISVGRIGAGISLWTLISDRRIEITYAEIISLDAKLSQPSPDAPLNIDYIIKAFAPKDKNKPPTRFDVMLRNVVIRKSRISFDKTYLPALADKRRIDFNHLSISNLRADIALPVIRNEEVEVDLRRLAFTEHCGLNVNSLSCRFSYTPDAIKLSGFKMRLADSDITLSDQNVPLAGCSNIGDAVKNAKLSVSLDAQPLILADFACFFPPLENFTHPSSLRLGVNGKLDSFTVDSFSFEDLREASSLEFSGKINGLPAVKEAQISDVKVRLKTDRAFNQKILAIIPGISDIVSRHVEMLGNLDVELEGATDLRRGTAKLAAGINADSGDVTLTADFKGIGSRFLSVAYDLSASEVNVGNLIDDDRIGLAELQSKGEVSVSGKDFFGDVAARIPYVEWQGERFENIEARVNKEGNLISGALSSEDGNATLSLDASCRIAGALSSLSVQGNIGGIRPASLGVKGFSGDETLSAYIDADLSGNSPDNIVGNVSIKDLGLHGGKRNFNLENLEISSTNVNGLRHYGIVSDLFSGSLNGTMAPTQVVQSVQEMLAKAMPMYFKAKENNRGNPDSYLNFNFQINTADKFYSLIKPPVRPGVPIDISGAFSEGGDSIGLFVNAPYLIQGRNKLLRNSAVKLEYAKGGAPEVVVTTDMPMKNDRAVLTAAVSALGDSVGAALEWEGIKYQSNKGRLSLDAHLSKSLLGKAPNAEVRINPSVFSLYGSEWQISPAHIVYDDKKLEVDGLKVRHDKEYVDIYGRASESSADVLNVALSGINLEYIFGILNIDHVDFGGIATGHAKVTSLFSKVPLAFTDGLFVKDLAYNGSVLGNGELESHWDNDRKMVAINADIDGPEGSAATVRGGVYVTRDSLSFDFGAKHLDIGFLKPFMSGFTSSVEGHASGNVKLYGTFSDIDLGGAVHADDISMLVDQSGVRYHGSDSLFFSPGLISIPEMTLYDKFGHTCRFEGTVRHNFLKDASFSFRMNDADRLLVFDTDSRDNPVWYGRIFANGSAVLKGVTGFVSLSANMSTAPDSEFTFVLDETEEASEYTFLTFSDRRKDELAEVEVEKSFEDIFYSNSAQSGTQETPSAFLLDLSLDVTPAAKMVIVMDPKAGDKITTNGTGALRMRYETNSDEFTIYGKYSLRNGWYNFSLQDLILKNFKIEEGSSISFNGDPMRGILDITAAYRVNSNLKDLDNSFASDPDLKRTVVPVDALLKVTGDIHAPEINFDIALPTVTSDVERKVRSIISTEDMLNRQVIYLLALNRFYTPEYTGAEQGGEIASVASSTLSSQIQNIIGSLTDRFTVAPSFKSEKSDLSDMEVDLALSSSFFDNRLLINGNLGYRDKSTSQTTFIGDFDLEYLLSRDGKLRLKAYNHFNDASYYLKSALTTQGIGIVYRKEFDDPLKFVKRLLDRNKKDRNKKKNGSGEPAGNLKQGEAVIKDRNENNNKQDNISK